MLVLVTTARRPSWASHLTTAVDPETSAPERLEARLLVQGILERIATKLPTAQPSDQAVGVQSYLKAASVRAIGVGCSTRGSQRATTH